MARIVAGVAASRSPMVSVPPELWPQLGERDSRSRRLKDREGNPVSYDELLRSVAPAVGEHLTSDVFREKYEVSQRALETLSCTLLEASPDVVVVMGDDEEENIHEDNRPAISIFWGDEYRMVPRPVAPAADELTRLGALAWGDRATTYPVASDLALRMIERLIEAEFDIATSRVQKPDEGMAHGFGFVYQRLLQHRPVAIVPIIINVHTPPNQPTPQRLYDFGQAVRHTLESFADDLRVAVVATGGLSVGIVDEELDRRALAGMQAKDVPALASLPRTWMQGSQGEVLCWIAAAGALDHLPMDLLAYIPGYRSRAGTGCGLAFARWQ